MLNYQRDPEGTYHAYPCIQFTTLSWYSESSGKTPALSSSGKLGITVPKMYLEKICQVTFCLQIQRKKIPPRQTGTTQSAIFVQRSKSHFWHRNQSDVRARGWQKCVVPIENDNCVCRILKSRIFNASNSNVPCLSRLGNYGKLLPLGEGDGGSLSWPIGSIDWSSLTRVLTSVI